jgi:hypothetical protein
MQGARMHNLPYVKGLIVKDIYNVQYSVVGQLLRYSLAAESLQIYGRYNFHPPAAKIIGLYGFI